VTADDQTKSGARSRSAPVAECDVVMKGGITSGVVYPLALCEIGSRYRLRGVGGASAGAIGAAVGAAAEFGRSSGGFTRLEALPNELGGGSMATLFQPQPSTKPLLRLMLVVTGNDRRGAPRSGPPPTGPTVGRPRRVATTLRRLLALVRRVAAFLASVVLGFPFASAIGVLPGVVLAVFGGRTGGAAGWLLVVCGVALLLVGWLIAVGVRLVHKLTVDVPGNLFGICRGLKEGSEERPGFTEWLSEQIDEVAGLPPTRRPLCFGHLWTGATEIPKDDVAERHIDLRMVTTCLSEGRPYEMPWEARRFFFEPETWRTLFPGGVVDALVKAPPPTALDDDDDEEWRWEEAVAATHQPVLHRLPDPQYLPVIVATRLSLSFPLLIAAVPLWTIDRRHAATQDTQKRYEAARDAGTPSPTSGLVFSRLWFTDGGFCSNFPVYMFDAALPSRPTFAINLGRFTAGEEPDPDQRENVEWARDNRSLLPESTLIPEKGFGAVGAFASAAVNTARNWQDGSYLGFPGYRDRIVRVLQTKREGGLNLYMDAPTIEGLAERGQTAGAMMVEQFNVERYPSSAPSATGWDNHRWVRYRALLSVLPGWLASYSRGRAVLNIDPTSPPSYRLNAASRELADRLTSKLDELAQVAASADPDALSSLTKAPRPTGTIRRIPRI
jgi:hypothetical protein